MWASLARAVAVAAIVERAPSRKGDRSVSMNFRFGNRSWRTEKIEIAADVSLANMCAEHRAVATLIARLRWPPRRVPSTEFLLTNMQMNPPRGHVDLDLVAGLHQRERAAYETFRRDVQDA